MCEHLVHSLKWARDCMLDVIKDWPADKFCFRRDEHDNHLIWTLGHLALSDEWILTMLTGEKSPLPEAYGALFGYQSKPSGELSDYPPFDEVRARFDTSRTRLLEWMNSADDAKLEAAVDDGGFDFARTGREAVMKEAWHEGWHAGQLVILRRAIGLKPAFAGNDA